MFFFDLLWFGGFAMYPNAKSAAYDRVATMFSPDGRLYQVEYASKIVGQGTMGVGIVFNDGILLGADKKIASKLIVPDSIEKLFKIDSHIGAVSAGLVGDARRLIQFAREKCQENQMLYEEQIEIESLVKELSAVKHSYTQYGGVRPFGVSFIIGGIDDTGKRLFETEPSGALAEYQAVAIGKGRNEAMALFEKEYNENMSFDDAIGLCLRALSKGLDEKEKLSAERLDFAMFDSSTKEFKRVQKNQVKNFLAKMK